MSSFKFKCTTVLGPAPPPLLHALLLPLPLLCCFSHTPLRYVFGPAGPRQAPQAGGEEQQQPHAAVAASGFAAGAPMPPPPAMPAPGMSGPLPGGWWWCVCRCGWVVGGWYVCGGMGECGWYGAGKEEEESWMIPNMGADSA